MKNVSVWVPRKTYIVELCHIFKRGGAGGRGVAGWDPMDAS